MSWYTVNGDTVTGFSAAYEKAGSSKDITIPYVIDGTARTKIGRNAFNSKKLLNIVVENGYQNFEYGAFCGNVDCQSMKLPNTLVTIEQDVFVNFGRDSDGSLGSVVLPSTLKTIGKYGFDGARWTRITVPDGCIVNNSWVFKSCPYLTYLKIGEGTNDFSHTFQQLPNLETLILPSTTRTFDTRGSFVALPALKSVYIATSSYLVTSGFAYKEAGMAPNATIYWNSTR